MLYVSLNHPKPASVVLFTLYLYIYYNVEKYLSQKIKMNLSFSFLEIKVYSYVNDVTLAELRL